MRLEPPYDPTDGRDYIRRDTSSVSARMHFADGAGVELVTRAPRAWSPRRSAPSPSSLTSHRPAPSSAASRMACDGRAFPGSPSARAPGRTSLGCSSPSRTTSRVGRRYFSAESMAQLRAPTTNGGSGAGVADGERKTVIVVRLRPAAVRRVSRLHRTCQVKMYRYSRVLLICQHSATI